MFRRVMLVLCLVLPAAACQGAAATAAEKLPPAAQWMPQNVAFAVELSNGKELLDAALDPQVTATVTSMPEYRKQTAQPNFVQFLMVLGYLEKRLDTDWKAGLHKLVDGGMTWAVTPSGGSLLIVDSTDARLLEQMHEVMLGHAKEEAAKAGQPGRVASVDYRGVTGWTFREGEAHIILGTRLILSNRAELLKDAIDLRAKPDGASLATSLNYQAARRCAGKDATAWAYVNLAMLKQIPDVQKVLTEQTNPMGSLLFAGVTDALRESSWLALKLRVQGDKVALQATVDGKFKGESSPTAFAWPGKPDQGAMPNLAVPRQIAGLSLYRDLHAFYAAKEKLFGERSSGLIFFENMMGIFFSGRDFTDDVLAQTKPEFRFVVAEQKYDPAVGTPQVQLPAFAAIFRLRDPKQYGDVIEEAWQKAVGLISVTRGQKASVGLIIDRPTHRDTRYSIAYFPTAGVEDKTQLAVQFNFRPSLVKLGDCVVLSSTEELAKDLIDAMKKEISEPPKVLSGVHSAVEIDAVQAASILDANRQNLVRQNMVEKGSTQEQAETQVGLLTAIVRHLGRATLTIGTTSAGNQANLEVKLNLRQTSK